MVMADNPEEPRGDRQMRGGSAGARKHDWIAKQLQRVYDEALDEDIPPEMMALLNKLDSPSSDREGGA